MNKTETKLFMDLLAEIPDHRRGNAVRHKLNEILTIAILSLLCNANTLTGMERFGQMHEKELREFLELPEGIPSHDTFGDVLARLDYGAVEGIFQNWLVAMKGYAQPKHIAIDGKTVRRSGEGLRKAAHIVTAYASDLQLVLGQVLTEEKSNEITAIPELLDTLDIAGSTVSIDAMGTQRAIAHKIVERGAEYILALKENQATLYEDAKLYYETDIAPQSIKKLREANMYAYTLSKGHGRTEKRECWIISGDLSGLRRSEVWPNLHGIAVIRSTRTVADGEQSVSYRYYMFSHSEMTSKVFLALQRQHWSIENGLQWVLDVTFREDALHARIEHIALVMNLLRKLVLQMLRHDTTISDSMSGKRERCAWSLDTALNILSNVRLS